MLAAFYAVVAGAPAPPTEDPVARLREYLGTYEVTLNSLVAFEEFEQFLTLPRRAAGDQTGAQPRRKRVLESDVLFLRLPGNAEWFGVRHTLRMDGHVIGSAGLKTLMSADTADIHSLAQSIVRDSSAHHLGPQRTINMPTVPLELLDGRRKDRLSFVTGEVQKVGGVTTVRVTFTERVAPSIVRSADGQHLLSTGTVWIEPTTGALRQVEVSFLPLNTARPGLGHRLRVSFTWNAALGLLVPSEMRETFTDLDQSFEGRARYSQYRRFGTSVRILPPPRMR